MLNRIKKITLLFICFLLISCTNLFNLYSEDKNPGVSTDGVFVACGKNGNLFYSDNGNNWSNDKGQTATYNLEAGCNAYDKYIVVGNNSPNNVYYLSNDGKNWNYSISAGADNNIFGIVYKNGMYVSAGYYNGDTTGRIFYSYNGIDWSSNTAPSGCNIVFDIIYGNGKFVAVGGGLTGPANVFVSSNGKSWSIKDLGNSFYLTKVVYGNGIFVAIPEANTGASNYYVKIFYSTDGTNWNEKILTSGSNSSDVPWGLLYGNGKFIVNVKNIGNFISTNGKNWTQYPEQTFYRGIYAENKFVAINDSSGDIIQSNDGINWQTAATVTSSGLYRIIYTLYNIEMP